ncbi:UNVERIFIED_CONTAM: hypothetical protein Sangu_0724300 [Sesamum angustifolium]|uniref:Uncharacterized protein n=1 Tax=Sesamum angustifolium TaxID=2727405 RepID=A0AAW2PU96_9LAMI
MIGRICSSIPSTNPSELKPFQTINGLQHLAEARRFKAWFLDQFGVLHDGKQPYPGAITTCMFSTVCFGILGLGLQVVDNVEDAEFVLAHGTEALGLSSGDALPMTLEELNKILEQCAAKRFLCCSELFLYPGTLAATYENLGGEVKWMGKPGEIIYKSAMAMVGMEAADCIAVGDSLHHDIRGANLAGISSAFITGGIHATELGLSKFGETAADSSVHSLASKYEAHPTYVLPSFTW